MSERSYIEAVSRQLRAARPGANGHAVDDAQDGALGPRRLIARRYLLGKQIGRGRLGDIYEGLDQTSGDLGVDRRVAIQLIDEPIGAAPNVVDELGRVYGALRAGAHPNVVRILDFGKDRRTFFVVMDLLEGVSLRSVLDSTASAPLSFEEAGPVILAVANALEYLHAKGLAYGEIRPEHVFVTFDYRVQLLDVAPVTALPFAPYFVEDATAQGVRTPDMRDNVYTLACLTYELLSGRHPFNANSPLEARRARLQPRPLAGLTPRRWAAIDRALEFQRENRTETVRQYLDELGLSGEERLQAPTEEYAQPTADAGPVPPAAGAPRTLERPHLAPPPAAPRAPYALRRVREGLRLSPAEHAALFRRFPTEETPRNSKRAPIVLGLAAVAALGLAFVYYSELRLAGAELLSAIDRATSDTRVVAVAPTPAAETGDTPGAAPESSDAGAVGATPVVVEETPAQPPSQPNAAAAPAAAPATGAAPPVPSTPERAVAVPPPVQVAQPAVSGTPVAPLPTVSFAQPVITVREGQSAASIVIRRSGDTSNGLTVTWWPSDGTAVVDSDYADVGRRTERFAPGEDSRTILVPLIDDNAREQTESFDVYVGRAGAASNHVDVLSSARVDIVDDD